MTVWMPPTLLDCPPGLSREEQKEWWEWNRERHNDFANKFNSDWINNHMRLLSFGLLPNAGKIKPMPSFEEVEADYDRLKTSEVADEAF